MGGRTGEEYEAGWRAERGGRTRGGLLWGERRLSKSLKGRVGKSSPGRQGHCAHPELRVSSVWRDT